MPRNTPYTLHCKAEGSPEPKIEWFKDGKRLTIEPSRQMLLPTGDLLLLSVTYTRRESDGGIYWCEARNELGIVRSRNATLRVATLRDEFRLEPQDTNAAHGETVMLECGPPRGNPEPIISWRKNGQTMDLTGLKRYGNQFSYFFLYSIMFMHSCHNYMNVNLLSPILAFGEINFNGFKFFYMQKILLYRNHEE